jgi:hypothetical protein
VYRAAVRYDRRPARHAARHQAAQLHTVCTQCAVLCGSVLCGSVLCCAGTAVLWHCDRVTTVRAWAALLRTAAAPTSAATVAATAVGRSWRPGRVIIAAVARGGIAATIIMLLLLLLLRVVTVLGSATPPLTLFVHPTDGSDEHDGTDASKPLATLTGAQRRLRSALLSETEARRDVVVELLPGSHRVPAGGLQLTLEDSPPGGEHWVRWRGAAYGGTSVHGGEPVTGWQPATDLGLPRGVMVAPAPRLPGGAARHLYVDGVRAARTRVNATLAVPGELSLEKKLRADGQDISDAYLTSTALNWSNAGDVEFVYAAGMAEPRCTIDHLEANSTTNRTKIYMKQPCMWNLINRDWGPVTTPPVWIGASSDDHCRVLLSLCLAPLHQIVVSVSADKNLAIRSSGRECQGAPRHARAVVP